MESLTEKVLQYQKSREGLRTLMDEIAPRVYQFPRRTMGWDEDACGDFYVFIHPRIVRLLDRFRDQGKPFESYLWAVLGWQLRNFARERRRSERAWQVSLRMTRGTSSRGITRMKRTMPAPCEHMPVLGRSCGAARTGAISCSWS